MILADTSVWVQHFRLGNKALQALLDAGTVLIHPFVVGGLALGNLRPRDAILRELQRLPHAGVATHDEILQLIEKRHLFGLGIGYVDIHLLAAVWLTGDTALWTHDKRLRDAAQKLGLAYDPK